MNLLNNLTLKEYLLKAYNEGFDAGCQAEAEASLGMDYNSAEYKEVERADVINEIATNAKEELLRRLRHSTRVQLLKTGLSPEVQKETLNKIMGQFNIPLDKWCELVITANVSVSAVKEEYHGV